LAIQTVFGFRYVSWHFRLALIGGQELNGRENCGLGATVTRSATQGFGGYRLDEDIEAAASGARYGVAFKETFLGRWIFSEPGADPEGPRA
jgi:hypothetical protein